MRSQIFGPGHAIAIAPALSVAYAIEIATRIVIARGAGVLEPGFVDPPEPYAPLPVDIQQIVFLRCRRTE